MIYKHIFPSIANFKCTPSDRQTYLRLGTPELEGYRRGFAKTTRVAIEGQLHERFPRGQKHDKKSALVC